jgi:hypothetical protein
MRQASFERRAVDAPPQTVHRSITALGSALEIHAPKVQHAARRGVEISEAEKLFPLEEDFKEF